MDGFLTLYQDEVLHCGTCGPLFFQRWRGGGDAEHLERMLGYHLRFVERFDRGTTLSFSHVQVVTKTPPNESARAVMQRHTELIEAKVASAATVISEGGFGGAMARGLVSGLLLVTRPKCPHKVCATTGEGFEFMLQKAPAAFPRSRPSELDRLYREHCKLT